MRILTPSYFLLRTMYPCQELIVPILSQVMIKLFAKSATINNISVSEVWRPTEMCEGEIWTGKTSSQRL